MIEGIYLNFTTSTINKEKNFHDVTFLVSGGGGGL